VIGERLQVLLQQDAWLHELIGSVRAKFALLRRPRQTLAGGTKRGGELLSDGHRPQL